MGKVGKTYRVYRNYLYICLKVNRTGCVSSISTFCISFERGLHQLSFAILQEKINEEMKSQQGKKIRIVILVHAGKSMKENHGLK